jgi:hypothetical protein
MGMFPMLLFSFYLKHLRENSVLMKVARQRLSFSLLREIIIYCVKLIWLDRNKRFAKITGLYYEYLS